MNANEVIKQIARDHNKTTQEVEREIRKAIRAAMSSPEPRAKEMWKRIAPDGKEPSIEKFLDFCVREIEKYRKNY